MDTSNAVLSGLIRKRQEIAAELDAAQSKLRQLILDIDALDATIRLFQPDIDLDAMKVRPTPRRHETHRGDTSRLITSLLRETAQPLARIMHWAGLQGMAWLAGAMGHARAWARLAGAAMVGVGG